MNNIAHQHKAQLLDRMHSFFRKRVYRLLVAIKNLGGLAYLGFILLFSPVYVSADGQKEYQQSVNKIGQQIKEITKNLNANRILLKTEQDKLAGVEQRIKTLQTAMAESEQEINRVRAQSEKNQQLIASAKADKQGNIAKLRQLIRQRYIGGQPSYVKMMLNQENPYAVGRLENYFDYFARAQQQQIVEAQQQLADIAELEQQQQSTLKNLELRKGQLDQQQAQLEAAKNQRAKTVARLDKKVSNTESKLKKLRRDRQRLNNLLKEIAAQAAELRRLEKQRDDAQKQSQPNRTEPAINRPKRALVAGGFSKQRGRLSCPLASKPKQSFGSRIAESGMSSQGLLYVTDDTQQVRSIYSGRVLFADYLKGYGLLLIIDHGDDHISLYGHNEVIYKKVGDPVQVDEVISKTGVSGGLKQPSLYFEVRRGATPVNPSNWCR